MTLRYSKNRKRSQKKRSQKKSRKRSAKRSYRRRSVRRSKQSTKRSYRRSVRRSTKRSKKRSTKRSKKRSSRKRFVLQKGTLSKFGYSADLSEASRYRALQFAIKHNGPLPIFRKLNAVYVLNRNTNPKKSRIFYKDRNFVKKYYM